MSTRDDNLPPRGKLFAAVRLSHAAGLPTPIVVTIKSGIATRAEANRACSAFDWRLSPTVILVDKGAAS